MEHERRKNDYISCMRADDETTRVFISKAQITHLFATKGGTKEARPLIQYMTVTVLEDGTDNNFISVWGVDDTHIADIAYDTHRGGWFICG